MESTVEQLNSIEARLAASQKQNLQQFQKEILGELYRLKQTFQQQLQTVSTNVQQPQAVNAPAKEDPKDLQIKELKAENTRLQYRIQHLTRNLRQRL